MLCFKEMSFWRVDNSPSCFGLLVSMELARNQEMLNIEIRDKIRIPFHQISAMSLLYPESRLLIIVSKNWLCRRQYKSWQCDG